MPENIDDESSHNPINVEPENSSHETLPATEFIKPKQETENMEVHHHPNVEKKRFKEYVLEGLMIFLAVSMGFVAENIREYFGDREKEKQNIENVIRCLASDTAQMGRLIRNNSTQLSYIDSLLLLKDKDLTVFENNVKFYKYALNGLFASLYFKPNDAAMQQLKSSGTLRLIHKQAIVDSLFQYELNNKIIKSQEEDCYFLMKNAWTKVEFVADESFFRNKNRFEVLVGTESFTYNLKNFIPLYINNDKKQLRLLYSNAATFGETIEFYIGFLQQQLQYATSIIKLIQKEYHFDKEAKDNHE